MALVYACLLLLPRRTVASLNNCSIVGVFAQSGDVTGAKRRFFKRDGNDLSLGPRFVMVL